MFVVIALDHDERQRVHWLHTLYSQRFALGGFGCFVFSRFRSQQYHTSVDSTSIMISIVGEMFDELTSKIIRLRGDKKYNAGIWIFFFFAI